ncbi:NusA-like transcription termination signal-binding factor [Candidatus Woesearchaeota archaeon]|nr:NusA-like transcription termination signal-binding factor [Candidatus Woesearchaeota archaeon]
MSRLKLDQDDLALSSLMERITRARVKDCFKDTEVIYFVVATGEIGKAVGKNGSNIRKAQEELGKRIKVIEFKDNAVDFVRSIIYPLAVESITEDGGIVLVKDSNKKTKSLLIGRESRNLQLINRAVKRFYNVEVKVV